MRPKLNVSFFCDSSFCGSFCASCRDNADNPICDDKEAKIAALADALKKLTGCDWVRKPGRESLLAKFKGRKGYHEKDKPKE